MSRRQAVIDLETTGLEPDRHELWECAVIFRDPGDGGREEHLYRVEPDLAKADPAALRVGQYYQRTERMKHRDLLVHDLARTPANRGGYWSHAPALAVHLARLLDDCTLIASNPAFDAGFLTAFLRAHGQAPTWHFRLKDFPSMAYGWLSGYDYAVQHEALRPEFGGRVRPFADRCPDLDRGTDDFAVALRLDPGTYERHSALGDARLVADGLDAVEGRKP